MADPKAPTARPAFEQMTAAADGTRVAIGGRPLCTTTSSTHLDPMVDGCNVYDNREAAALRIALCWNACRDIPDEKLVEIAALRKA